MFYKLYSLLVRINDLFIAKTGVEFEKEYDFGEFYIVKSQIENFFIKPTFSANFSIDGLRQKTTIIIRKSRIKKYIYTFLFLIYYVECLIYSENFSKKSGCVSFERPANILPILSR